MKYDWLSFFDIDEFLELKKIIKYLKNVKMLKLTWLWYNSNNSLYNERRPLAQRINIHIYDHYSNKLIKSTVRSNLSINYWNNMIDAYTSLNIFSSCSISGKLIKIIGTKLSNIFYMRSI